MKQWVFNFMVLIHFMLFLLELLVMLRD